MNYTECPRADACDIGAMFDEASVYMGMSEDSIQSLGLKEDVRAVNGVTSGILEFFADNPDERAAFDEGLPKDEASRCEGCLLGRNGLVHLLSDGAPDDVADLL